MEPILLERVLPDPIINCRPMSASFLGDYVSDWGGQIPVPGRGRGTAALRVWSE